MGLMLRGTTWYYRRTIKAALRPFFGGRREVWVSLRTTDKEAAKLKALRVGFEVERQMQEARKRLHEAVTPDDAVREWQRRALAEDAEWRQTAQTPTEEQLDAELEALSDAIADHRESLSQGDTAPVKTLLDEVLREQGLHVSPQDRQSFALSLLRSRLEALEVVMKRATSRVKGEPPAPLDEPLTVSELVEAWLKERQPHPKTEIEWRTACRRFEAVNGKGLLVKQVTKSHVRAFKASLLAAPSKLSSKGTLSPKTVRKALGALSSVFKWGVGQGYLDHSPFTGLTFVAKDRSMSEDHRRQPYSAQDLKTIFNAPLFASPVLHSTPAPRRFLAPDGTPAARYWIPILAAYSGARLEELGGLRVQDVRQEEGVWYLDITPHEQRGLKTVTSRRKVPLHPEVLRLGFLNYAKNCPAEGRLFPDLKAGAHGAFTGAFSQWWARFMDELGLTDKRNTFHSFRHGFKDACRRAGMPEEVHDAVTGHKTASVGRSYGLGVPLPVLAEWIAKVRYSGLTMSTDRARTGGGGPTD